MVMNTVMNALGAYVPVKYKVADESMIKKIYIKSPYNRGVLCDFHII